jgi:hypothetical protein
MYTYTMHMDICSVYICINLYVHVNICVSLYIYTYSIYLCIFAFMHVLFPVSRVRNYLTRVQDIAHKINFTIGNAKQNQEY